MVRTSENSLLIIPAGIYLLKVNNRNTRTRCEISSELTIKTPERRQADMFKVNNRNTRTRCAICSKLTIKTAELRQASFFIVNSEHISHLVLVFRLLTAGWNSARTIHHHTYELSKVSKFIKLHHFWFWIGAWD